MTSLFPKLVLERTRSFWLLNRIEQLPVDVAQNNLTKGIAIINSKNMRPFYSSLIMSCVNMNVCICKTKGKQKKCKLKQSDDKSVSSFIRSVPRDYEGCSYWRHVTEGCSYWHNATEGCSYWHHVTEGCSYWHHVTEGCSYWHHVTAGCSHWHHVTEGCSHGHHVIINGLNKALVDGLRLIVTFFRKKKKNAIKGRVTCFAVCSPPGWLYGSSLSNHNYMEPSDTY